MYARGAEQLDQIGLEGRIESGGRLVRDEECRLGKEDSGEADPALLAPRQLMGKGPAAITKPESAEGLFYEAVGVFARSMELGALVEVPFNVQ